MDKLVVIDDCKRCILHGEGVRCVRIVGEHMEVQILDNTGAPVLIQKRIIGECAVTDVKVREIAEKWAELARRDV